MSHFQFKNSGSIWERFCSERIHAERDRQLHLSGQEENKFTKLMVEQTFIYHLTNASNQNLWCLFNSSNIQIVER